MKAYEVNFEGLVGPTHNYAGLSYGNVASMSHQAWASNPREAALQGLRKAKALLDLGIREAIFPPHERPHIRALYRLGFRGRDEEILAQAAKKAPLILAACSSASAMWTANAATVSPSFDSTDGKVHFTPANLNQKLHRSIEPATTSRLLKAMFPGQHFVHHQWLIASDALGDEGAANHTRLCRSYGEAGVQFFVYGREALKANALGPKKFPARHTREASEAIARSHLVREKAVVFAQQNPDAIDAGAFHNDVVSVGNQNMLFYHEDAFDKSDEVCRALSECFAQVCDDKLKLVKVPGESVSLRDAVSSYLFNSQLISLPQGGMALVAPQECQENPAVSRYLQQLSTSDTFAKIYHFDLRQSMNNGGGPACLRLRVVLSEEELRSTNQRVLLTDKMITILEKWVTTHYRDRLSAADLADPQLLRESRAALDELTQILELGSVYPFQR